MPSVSALPSASLGVFPILEQAIKDLKDLSPQTKEIEKAIKSIGKAIKDLEKGDVVKAAKDLLKALKTMDCASKVKNGQPDDVDDICFSVAEVFLQPTNCCNQNVDNPIDELFELLGALDMLPKKDKKAKKSIEKAIENLQNGASIVRSLQRDSFARNLGDITYIGVKDSSGGKSGKGGRSRSKSRSGKNYDLKAAKDLLDTYEDLGCDKDPQQDLVDICSKIRKILFTVLTEEVTSR